MITGEAVPVRKSAGDSVIGGTINVSGALWLRVRALGADSAVHRIMKLVCEAQMRRPKVNPHPHPHSHPHPHPHSHPHHYHPHPHPHPHQVPPHVALMVDTSWRPDLQHYVVHNVRNHTGWPIQIFHGPR